MKAIVHGITLFVTALLDLTSVQRASAQTAQPNPSDLSEVIVTARRIEERAQDAPISMTVLNQKRLADRAIVTSSDLAAATPGLSVDSEFGQGAASFSIRGFVQQLQSAAERRVAAMAYCWPMFPSLGIREITAMDLLAGRGSSGNILGTKSSLRCFLDVGLETLSC